MGIGGKYHKIRLAFSARYIHECVNYGWGSLRILRFGSVLGFASTVRFYHGFLNGLLMTFLGYKTTQWNAWLNLPERKSSGKFLSLATFSTLRRLLSIVKVGRVPDLRDFEMAV